MESDEDYAYDTSPERTSAPEERNAAILREHRLGIACLDLSALNFETSLTQRHRPVDHANVARLERVFALQGCQRHFEENYVDAIVDRTELAAELASQSLDVREAFAASSKLAPKLGLTRVDCLHGLHRVYAARNFFEHEADQWWTVRLYARKFHFSRSALATDHLFTPDEALPEDLTRRLIDAFLSIQPFTDGEVFWNIRYYATREPDEHARSSWTSRLTKTKQKSLSRLLRKPGFANAFDALLDVPGLWRPVKLGALHRLLSLRCDEEMLRYLSHIKRVWHSMLGDPPAARPDAETTAKLELLCPGLSEADAGAVVELIQSASVFRDVRDEGRIRSLQRLILSIKTLIPSLRTFFEHLKYLEPCCAIMRSLVDLRGAKTLCSAYRKSYRAPTWLQVDCTEQERRFYSPGDNTSDWRHAAYLQLWLYTLRSFPEMTVFSCRKESGKQKPSRREPDPAICRDFAKLAMQLGFQTKTARVLSLDDPDAKTARQLLRRARLAPVASDERFVKPIAEAIAAARLACSAGTSRIATDLTCNSHGESIARRCGMPYEDSHIADRRALYLPLLTARQHDLVQGYGVTSLFAKRDMLLGFLGECKLDLDHLWPTTTTTGRSADLAISEAMLPSPGPSSPTANVQATDAEIQIVPLHMIQARENNTAPPVPSHRPRKRRRTSNELAVVIASAAATGWGFEIGREPMPESQEGRAQMWRQCHAREQQLYDGDTFRILTEAIQLNQVREVWVMNAKLRGAVSRYYGTHEPHEKQQSKRRRDPPSQLRRDSPSSTYSDDEL